MMVALRGSTELLERERELAALAELVAVAAAGSGCAAVVEGPAGAGKSRLLAAGRAEADTVGMRALTARGSALEHEFAFGVVRQLFEPALAAAGEAGRAELWAGPAGQAAALFEHSPNASSQVDGGSTFATLHGLFWLVANLGARNPLLLSVDDLQWCDEPSLRFLVHLLPRLDGLPVLLLAAARPAEPGSEQHLQAQITVDPLVTMMHPAPLTPVASARVVRTLVSVDAEDLFCAACHAATGGNPLLLRELSGVLAAENVEPTAGAAARVPVIGSRAVARRVSLWLARLGPAAGKLARAVAVLGTDADPSLAAALAGLEPGEALRVAGELAAIELLQPYRTSGNERAPSRWTLGFVHPLVQAAVYEGLSPGDRVDAHAVVARLLDESGAAPERVAAHLLLTPPAGDHGVVATLRQAASEALRRRSPEVALTYLERAIAEPPGPADQVDVLVQAGETALQVDMSTSARHLGAALALVVDPHRRGVIVEMLGRALWFLVRDDEAVQLYAMALRELPAEHADLRRQLEGGRICALWRDPTFPLARKEVDRLRDATPDPGLGGRQLDCWISAFDANTGGGPAGPAVARARRGLAGGVLIERANACEAFVDGCFVLLAADLDEGMALWESSLVAAHQQGSMSAYAVAKEFRSVAWLWKGSLAEAEADAREAMQMILATRLDYDRPSVAAFLASTLTEQGRLSEAAEALDLAGPSSVSRTWYWIFDSRAYLLLAQGRNEEALAAMLASGREFAKYGGDNPAFVAWRSGAALALHALGRPAEARAMAAEEVTLARAWGAPRGLGRALRVMGMVTGGADGLAMLRESVAVLGASPARLELARSHVELGAALRRAGHRIESRHHLRVGVELAEICGAAPVVEQGRTELRATGARPRSVPLSGIAALTPSELRVAQLATAGGSNRDVAQALFVTTKTVEVHLTSAYRKLGITSRTDLATVLTAATNG